MGSSCKLDGRFFIFSSSLTSSIDFSLFNEFSALSCFIFTFFLPRHKSFSFYTLSISLYIYLSFVCCFVFKELFCFKSKTSPFHPFWPGGSQPRESAPWTILKAFDAFFIKDIWYLNLNEGSLNAFEAFFIKKIFELSLFWMY